MPMIFTDHCSLCKERMELYFLTPITDKYRVCGKCYEIVMDRLARFAEKLLAPEDEFEDWVRDHD